MKQIWAGVQTCAWAPGQGSGAWLGAGAVVEGRTIGNNTAKSGGCEGEGVAVRDACKVKRVVCSGGGGVVETKNVPTRNTLRDKKKS